MKLFSIFHGVPVLIYHHINYNYGELTPEDFEEQMKYLSDRGYKTLFIDDLVRLIKEKKTLGKKIVALTFDDGYLDNWVYVYPILKKYKAKATIFVITSRIKDKSPSYRFNLEDVWTNRCEWKDLPFIDLSLSVNIKSLLNTDGSLDFVTWEESSIMEKSGYIDIQSHTHLHSDAFISNEIIDFNRNDPTQNYFLATGWATGGDKRMGIPFYKRASSVAARIYHDDKRLRDTLADYVSRRPYSLRKKQELNSLVNDFKKKTNLNDRYESNEERNSRIIEELILSKHIIERKLKKKCSYLCWPWGEYQDFSIKCAISAGYKGTVTCDPGTNTRKTSLMGIKRIPHSRKLWRFNLMIFIYSNPILSEAGILTNRLLSIMRLIAFRLKNKSLTRALLGELRKRYRFAGNYLFKK